jgi:hypothetical protein
MIGTLPEAGFTLPEASKIIGCHPKHIYKIVSRGQLQTFLGLDNRLRISKEELHYYLRRREEQS